MSACIRVRCNERWPAGSPPGAGKAAEPDPGDTVYGGGATASLVDGYEQLRERVLTGRPDGWRLGHAVLAGKGMVAWIGAWATLAPAAAGTSAPDPPVPTTMSLSTPTSTPSTDQSAALSSLPCAGQLVAVLAQMALAHA